MLPEKLKLTDPLSTLRLSQRLLETLQAESATTVAHLLWLSPKRICALRGATLRRDITDLQARLWEGLREKRVTVPERAHWREVLCTLPGRIHRALSAESFDTIAEVAWAVRTGKLEPQFTPAMQRNLSDLLCRLGVSGMPYDPSANLALLSPRGLALVEALRGRGVDPQRPWSEVLRSSLPGRVMHTLHQFGLFTMVEVIAAMESGVLIGAPNFGKVSLDSLRSEVERVALYGPDTDGKKSERPRTVSELADALFSSPQLGSDERRLLARRFLQGETLSELAASYRVSRERVRQRIAALVRRLARGHQETARQLLAEVVRRAEAQGGLVQKEQLLELCDEDGLGRVQLCLRVCGEEFAVIVPGFLSTRSSYDLQQGLLRFRAVLLKRRDVVLSPQQVLALLDSVVGVRLPFSATKALLHDRLNLTLTDEGLTPPRSRTRDRDVLLERLCHLLEFAKRPLHAEELAAAYRTAVQDEGTSACTARMIHKTCQQHPDIYRTSATHLIHRLYLPLSDEQIQTISDLCVAEVRRATGPVSMSYLLGRVAAAGLPTMLLSRQLLLDLLLRRPELKSAGRVHLVPAEQEKAPKVGIAWLEDALLRARRPLAVEQLVKGQPPQLGLRRTTILTQLRRADFALCVEGRYLHMSKLGLSLSQVDELTDRALGLLPADGDVVAFAPFSQRLREAAPLSALLGDDTTLQAVLCRDGRVRFDKGGLIARRGEGSLAQAPLIGRLIEAQFRLGQPFMMQIFHDNLRARLGYSAARATFDSQVGRLVELGLVRRLDEPKGCYVRQPVDSRQGVTYPGSYAAPSHQP